MIQRVHDPRVDYMVRARCTHVIRAWRARGRRAGRVSLRGAFVLQFVNAVSAGGFLLLIAWRHCWDRWRAAERGHLHGTMGFFIFCIGSSPGCLAWDAFMLVSCPASHMRLHVCCSAFVDAAASFVCNVLRLLYSVITQRCAPIAHPRRGADTSGIATCPGPHNLCGNIQKQ
jgi:hypothetical protein